MFDLERRNAGLVAVARLKCGHRAAAIATQPPQLVQRRVIAFGNISTLGRIQRRVGHQRPRQFVDQRAMPIKRGQK